MKKLKEVPVVNVLVQRREDDRCGLDFFQSKNYMISQGYSRVEFSQCQWLIGFGYLFIPGMWLLDDVLNFAIAPADIL